MDRLGSKWWRVRLWKREMVRWGMRGWGVGLWGDEWVGGGLCSCWGMFIPLSLILPNDINY